MSTFLKPHMVFPGDVFCRLTVVSFSHLDKRWRRHYLCRCQCGVEKTIQGTLLRSGNTKSCGCLVQESARNRCLPHGVSSMNLVYAGYRHKAKKAGVSFMLTKEQFSRIVARNCFYCGSEVSNVCKAQSGSGDFAYNGIDKIDPSKGYTINNVVASCKRCNMAKSNRSQGEFIQWIRRAYTHLLKTAMADQWGNL